MRNLLIFILVVLPTFIFSCKSANEREYDRITDVFKENEKEFKEMFVLDEMEPSAKDSMEMFTDDLLILDYSTFLDKYQITNEAESGFLKSISVTAEVLIANIKLKKSLENSQRIIEDSQRDIDSSLKSFP